jgi:hypothetical protein
MVVGEHVSGRLHRKKRSVAMVKTITVTVQSTRAAHVITSISLMECAKMLNATTKATAPNQRITTRTRSAMIKTVTAIG